MGLIVFLGLTLPNRQFTATFKVVKYCLKVSPQKSVPVEERPRPVEIVSSSPFSRAFPNIPGGPRL